MHGHWKDVTSYSQGDDQKEPRVLEVMFGSICLKVHRHIHYPTGKWLASCLFFKNRELASPVLSEAKSQAVAKLQVVLEAALNEIVNPR